MEDKSSTPNVVQEMAPLHPLQQNWREGPKGAYYVKMVENGVYVRVDMPGVKSEANITLTKMPNDTSIRFFAIAPKHDEFMLDDSKRIYMGFINVQCDNFEQVSMDKTLTNGTCRIRITGAINNAFLTFGIRPRIPSGTIVFFNGESVDVSEEAGGSSIIARSPAPQLQRHLRPDSLRVEGLLNSVRHDANCRCCKGEREDKTPSGPLTEKMGHINPFVVDGVKGVFEAKFEALSSENFMYFRMDMPDCAPESYCETINENEIILKAATEDEEDHPFDAPASRRSYVCKLKMKCSCCSFDVSCSKNKSVLVDGVLRLIVKMTFRIANVTAKVDVSDRVKLETGGSSSGSSQPGKSSSSATGGQRGSRRRAGRRR